MLRLNWRTSRKRSVKLCDGGSEAWEFLLRLADMGPDFKGIYRFGQEKAGRLSTLTLGYEKITP